MAQQWILYGTLACHLCEQASEIVSQLQQSLPIDVKVVDITDDPSLVELYGEQIPVIKNLSNGQTLGWPFDPEILTDWLEPFSDQLNRSTEN